MTKKAAAMLLAASLAVSMCATPVFAGGPTVPGVHGGELHEGYENDGFDNRTTVKYEVTEGYTWAVPSTIDFGSNAGVNKKRTVFANQEKDGVYSKAEESTPGSSGNVYVTGCRIKPGQTLNIYIYSTNTEHDENGFYIETENEKNGAKKRLNYQIYKGKVTDPASTSVEKLNENSKVLSLEAGTDSGKQDLTFILDTAKDKSEIVGNYTGNLTFLAGVAN